MKKGQSVIEYVLLVAIAVIALVVGSNFVAGLKGGAFETHFLSAQYRINNPGSALVGTPEEELPEEELPEEELPEEEPPKMTLQDCLDGKDTNCNLTYDAGIEYCCRQTCTNTNEVNNVKECMDNPPNSTNFCEHPSTDFSDGSENCQQHGEYEREYCCKTNYGS